MDVIKIVLVLLNNLNKKYKLTIVQFKVNIKFILIFALVSIFCNSYAQKKKAKSSKVTFVTKKIGNKEDLLKDTLFLKQLAKLSGDSALKEILKGFDKSSSNTGEFSSSDFKISFPLKSFGWVNDYENIFTAQQILELDSTIKSFEKETTNEIVIVTIDSSWVTDENFENLSLKIFNSWGIGKKIKNNGILIFFSAGHRRIRIQNGYGIEKN